MSTTDFKSDLALGQRNEQVVARDLKYRGLELISPPPGKHPFDFYLPDGRSIEIKLDLYSQARSLGAIEFPTLQRHADFYIHTLCYYLVFPNEAYRQAYQLGKIPERKGGLGEQNYDGRLVKTQDLRALGMYGSQFVQSLMQQQ